MKKLIIKSTKHHLVIAAAVLVLAFVGFHSLFSHRASAESLVPSANEHIITLHDDGQDKGFITKESTLRAALAKEHIRLDPNDRTEPDLDASLVASSYQVNIYRARVVAVRDGIVETKIITSYRTAKQIGEQAKIALHDEDLVTLVHSKDMIRDGAAEVMTIERATPFDFVFYGKDMTSYTRAKTVGEMLKEKGIKLGAQDGISIDPKTPISAGLHVSVWRNGIQTVTQEEVIAKPTEQIKDADQPVGYHQIKKAGTDGKKNVTYEINMRDGKEISRKAIASVTTQEPVTEVVVVGTKAIPGNGLSKSKGVNLFVDSNGVAHRETYYDLPMSTVMRNCGSQGLYTVRADGVKVDKDGYLIIAAYQVRYPRCSIVETSLGLGKVYDTGSFTSIHPDGFDLATDWSNNNGV